TPAEIIARLSELRGYALLTGIRNQQAVDLTTLGAAVAGFAATFAAHSQSIAIMEINPLLATGSSLVMLDALIIPAGVIS
ncbi:MAG TPA: acetate--CoA ligase family protein, partial [Thermomicrobiales bacterium]|nr:acetate--CoA ligase family protein [Thermomicrobiales bacterium]